ncbi:MAG: hypothetical protein V4662_19755 [Verrucomicrobiota bacterium]
MRPLLLSLLMSTALCADDKVATLPEPAAKPSPSSEPDKVSDGWEKVSAADAGLKAAPLDEMLKKLEDGSYKNIHSVLLAHKASLSSMSISAEPMLKAKAMVAVFTGWNIGQLTEQPFDMLQRYIIPAVDVK